VLSVDVHARPSEVVRLFAEYPVHHLPVVEGARVVGMLSTADIMKLDTFLSKLGAQRSDYLDKHMRMETLMRRPAITVRPEESVENAARLMVKHAIHALPVTDAHENLVGIVTTTDIMHAAIHPERRQNAHDAPERPVAARMTPSQLEAARLAAKDATSTGGGDPSVAQALLQAFERIAVLEHVLQCAERYVRAGQDEQLHKLLVKAIDQARGNPPGRG
jgi:predicted transcriptional regulator